MFIASLSFPSRTSFRRSYLLSQTLKSVSTYNHLDVEKKWQHFWEVNKTFAASRRTGHKKKYVLDMFPYPSGSGLHVGHPEGYTATDIMARYWRMNDYDVLHPMGWDAFGLPAEQHAINTGTHPSVTTLQNIATFKRQLKSLGFSFDWSREISTTDESYVKWTQWIFLQLFKGGLAFQSDVNVNWCPALGTVLANEEIIDGLSERGNHPVVRLPLRQWVLKITQYADRLENDLNKVNWPEGTLSAQKQWIGRSDGALIKFDTENMESYVEVFTTRPDTLMGATYLVLAPEHPLVEKLTSDDSLHAVREYIKLSNSKSDLERTSTGKDKGKSGVFLGAFVKHPISGERLPVWIADYVLAGYGTGAVMAVPAHDDRDFVFAEKFQLPVKAVIFNTEESSLPYFGNGAMINCGNFDGMKNEDFKLEVFKMLESSGKGKRHVSYKLRDWVFSRQRYWGEPIPIYFPVEIVENDQNLTSPLEGAPVRIRYDQPIPVDESELPLKLPEMNDFHPGDDPQGCLARATSWRFFQKNESWFARETNTMPQWAGSCWYYLRFAEPESENSLVGKDGSSWLPVDLYVGGQEHAVLHLLYARFWHKVLFDIGVVDHPEPFLKLVHQGMILGSDGEKMSKSRGNVINPDEIVEEFGADALRLYEMFMGPLEAVKPWQTSQLLGVVRFRDRVYNLHSKIDCNLTPSGNMNKEMNRTIKKVTEDIEKMSFNTAISALMIFTNLLSSGEGHIPKRAYENLIILLSPFAPHVAEECWSLLGHQKSLAREKWPIFDEEQCVDSSCIVIVQVNGKVRAKIEVAAEVDEEEVLSLASLHPNIAKHIDGMKPKKIVYVRGKILNIVV